MVMFAHHMAVELFGREFAPHGTLQHVCVFAAVALVMATSAYGSWTLFKKAREVLALGPRYKI
jgi:hypothetical protein